MNNILNKQDGTTVNPRYATPFNVDLSEVKSTYFEEYLNRVRSLPESIKNILMDYSTAEFIEERLGPSFNLTLEQKIEITRIIRDILLADTNLGDFVSNISTELGVDQNEAAEIANNLASNLLTPAFEDIRKIQGERLPEKNNQPQNQSRVIQKPKVPMPDINRNNIVDLRNKEQ